MSNQALRFPIILSIGAAILTLGIKSAAYFLTDSVSLLSDASESLVNLVAAITAYICLWYAAQPVDQSHTYGHEKIEYFSSGIEGILIFFAGLGIIVYAIRRLINPESLKLLEWGTLISLAAALINLFVAQLLLRVGRKHHSIVLEADGKHLMTDVWTSVGVLGGLFLVWLTGWEILDPILAIGVGLSILWTAGDLIHQSFNGLMDHALPPEEMELVKKAILSQLQPHLVFHALRTRQAGARRFIEFHLLVPGDWLVREGHALANRIEKAIREILSARTEITIHIEPLEEMSSWEDSDLIRLEMDLAKKQSVPNKTRS